MRHNWTQNHTALIQGTSRGKLFVFRVHIPDLLWKKNTKILTCACHIRPDPHAPANAPSRIDAPAWGGEVFLTMVLEHGPERKAILCPTRVLGVVHERGFTAFLVFWNMHIGIIISSTCVWKRQYPGTSRKDIIELLKYIGANAGIYIAFIFHTHTEETISSVTETRNGLYYHTNVWRQLTETPWSAWKSCMLTLHEG